MEIKEGQTFGKLSLEFWDVNGVGCDLWVESGLNLNIDSEFASYSQEDIKQLLPYLQAFAETGNLEPQSPLQGGSVDEEKLELDKAKKEASYYRRQCDKYVDHVANLEELIEEWRSFCELERINNAELEKKTSKLLGEEEP